jgi:glycosyltransferase involved in cell wall biosynthesis
MATYWDIPHVGGVWNYMVQLKEQLESLGHEVDILGYGEENTVVQLHNKKKLSKEKYMPYLESKLNKKDYPEVYLNDLVRYTEFQRVFYEIAALNFGLDEYDVIHTQDIISTVCLSRVKPEKTPLIASLHGCVSKEINHQLNNIHKSSTSYLASGYFNDIEKRGSMGAYTIIVANQWLKSTLTDEFQIPAEKINVYHYGYDKEAFLKRIHNASAVPPTSGKKVITYTGRLVELKGVHHLLTALGQLKKLRNDWVCWIVGEGDKLAGLRLQSRTEGIEEDVVFLKNREDVPNLLVHSDIFVQPSLLENQPLSVIEAQLLGLPVVVSNAGGLPEMVNHEETGLVFPTGNTEELCRMLNSLLENDDYRKTLGVNAQRFASSHWDMDLAVSRIVEVYTQAVNTVSL